MNVLVSLDAGLVRRIDQAAKARGLSRGAYLARLAEQDLGSAHDVGIQPSARAALRRLDRIFSQAPDHGDSTDAIRADRDSR